MTTDKTRSAAPARPGGTGLLGRTGTLSGARQSPLPEPQSIAQTGLSDNQITDLVLKSVYVGGQISGNDICREIKLPFTGVVQPTLDFLKREEMVSVVGTRGVGERGYQYALAAKGVERVREAMGRTQYVGPAPVPLNAWAERVRLQSTSGQIIRPDDVRAALGNMVLNASTVRKIGPAVNSGKSIFLYGPPGNGKTTIAQAIGHMLKGLVFIPYAVDVDGQVIRVYDRLNHEAVALDSPEYAQATGESRIDERWVLCRRPVVIVGGELTLDNLDLIYDPSSKFYEAPFQMRASNGLFLIDDFGRQATRPQDLLNRWIVPLETRIDFLTLHTGKKIEVPFDQLIVFSTNLDPKSLMDEAFLRRIRHKIYVGDPTDAEFYQIFQRMAVARNVPFDQQVFIYLLQEWYIKKSRALKAVHPRDILDQIIDIANYEGIAPMMTKDLIDQACDAYFVQL
ncbi:MAG: AAA family ATPase [Chloroflexi bacterium]|nr:AAA family ATPase [Chloroflexota bacterium]